MEVEVMWGKKKLITPFWIKPENKLPLQKGVYLCIGRNESDHYYNCYSYFDGEKFSGINVFMWSQNYAQHLNNKMIKRFVLYAQHPRAGYQFNGFACFVDGAPVIIDLSTGTQFYPDWCLCIGDAV